MISGSNFRALALLILLLSGSVAANMQLGSLRSSADNQRMHLPQAEWLIPLSFGYRNMWADVLWIRAISWFGGHQANADYTYLSKLLNAIVHLNPRAEHAYYMAGAILPWNTNSTRFSRPLLEKAMRNLPNAWRWPYTRGFNAYWFDHDTIEAARLLKKAAFLPAAPPLVMRLALRMQASAGQLDTALMFLQQMMREKQDAHIHNQLLVLSRHIETEQVLRRIDAQLASLGQHFHDMRDLMQLRQAGVNIPLQLPDGGKIVMQQNGEIVSSILGKRFKVFTPPKRKVKP
ncbi:MAG: hypothetical protein R8K53_07270 [Mariprofundaceae bacterium]